MPRKKPPIFPYVIAILDRKLEGRDKKTPKKAGLDPAPFGQMAHAKGVKLAQVFLGVLTHFRGRPKHDKFAFEPFFMSS